MATWPGALPSGSTVKDYVANCDVLLDDLDGFQFTVNNYAPDSTYVTSPLTHYVSCAPASARPLGKILAPCNFDRAIYVNNSLFPTCLYPKIDRNQVDNLVQKLSQKYPTHAIGFRGIHSHLIPTFEYLDLVFARPIYLSDPEKARKARMFKSDLKLLNQTDYAIIRGDSISSEDIPRLRYLYRSLYIQKYSHYSPDITEKGFAHLLKTISFICLKKNDQIDAVLAYYTVGDTMTAPIFGYDPTVAQETGLYRMISTLLTLEAEKAGVQLNQSAGAGSYKKLRKGKRTIEYTAFALGHLPFKQRLAWKGMKRLLNYFGPKHPG